MDAKKYISMLRDNEYFDLKKMEYKYSKPDVAEMLELLEKSAFKKLSLPDFSGKNNIVYSDVGLASAGSAIKNLMGYTGGKALGLKAAEDEIVSTFSIEQIATSRESVRKILAGTAPEDEAEKRIYGMKKGFEFISDRDNTISASSLRKLYEIMINPFLPEEDRLCEAELYRSSSVSVVDQTAGKTVHAGIEAAKLGSNMDALFAFVNAPSDMDDLAKAACIHFYISWLHPYYDGNGRMARMLHLWYLVQKGYSSVLFMPFSSLIARTKKDYYRAFDLVEQNCKISGHIDVSPFISYFIKNVYGPMGKERPEQNAVEEFLALVDRGLITEKEKDLFNFALSFYGTEEFSTKQMERDYGKCAYATIRSFVLKLSSCGVLKAHVYGGKTKYSIE